MFDKTKDGKIIEYVILNKDFWKNIIIRLKGTLLPLIEVFQLVDSNQNLVVGFTYETIDPVRRRYKSRVLFVLFQLGEDT